MIGSALASQIYYSRSLGRATWDPPPLFSFLNNDGRVTPACIWLGQREGWCRQAWGCRASVTSWAHHTPDSQLWDGEGGRGCWTPAAYGAGVPRSWETRAFMWLLLGYYIVSVKHSILFEIKLSDNHYCSSTLRFTHYFQYFSLKSNALWIALLWTSRIRGVCLLSSTHLQCIPCIGGSDSSCSCRLDIYYLFCFLLLLCYVNLGLNTSYKS